MNGDDLQELVRAMEEGKEALQKINLSEERILEISHQIQSSQSRKRYRALTETLDVTRSSGLIPPAPKTKRERKGTQLKGALVGAVVGTLIEPGLGTILGALLGGAHGVKQNMRRKQKEISQGEVDSPNNNKALVESETIDNLNE